MHAKDGDVYQLDAACYEHVRMVSTGEDTMAMKGWNVKPKNCNNTKIIDAFEMVIKR